MAKDPIDIGIDAGLKACDLLKVANEDLIHREHLRRFLEAAIAAIEVADRKVSRRKQVSS